MAPKPVKEIKENYITYKSLCNEKKVVMNKQIDVAKVKQQHPNIKTGKAPLTHTTIEKQLNCEVEVKIGNNKDFKFKLHCPEIFQRPFFRYDSAGAAHYNPDTGVPLKDRQVLTPHFHKFNADGYELAYHTEPLKVAKQLIALEDINTCFMHFCEESNMRLANDNFPEIVLDKSELGLTFTNEDPHENIDFK